MINLGQYKEVSFWRPSRLPQVLRSFCYDLDMCLPQKPRKEIKDKDLGGKEEEEEERMKGEQMGTRVEETRMTKLRNLPKSQSF
uniref:Neur_chan_LBD domain-containing protein n=1 Tax=Caenorhabditis tropicalis TaxID=1561998 RepID=A0A1I7UD07_9PELO